MLLCGGLCVGWLILGGLADRTDIAFWFLAGLLIAGCLYAIGGRRTSFGRQTKAQVLGLRQYLKRISKEELQRLTAGNPDYYFAMAPYAIALGVGKPFAKAFGKLPIPECPYLADEAVSPKTAQQWNLVLTQAVRKMDERYRGSRMERLKRIWKNSRR